MRTNATAGDLAERVHSVAIRVLRHVRPADAESGLSAARLSALSVLVFGGPRTVGALAEAEQVTAATMSRLLSGLESEGLVTRGADPSDGRRVRVAATAEGRAVLEAGRRRRVERLASLLAGVSGDRRRLVLEAVEVLESTLSSEPGARGRGTGG